MTIMDDYHEDGTECAVAQLLALVQPAEIFPRGDIADHTPGRSCLCGPQETDDGVLLVHISFDGREHAERYLGLSDLEH